MPRSYSLHSIKQAPFEAFVANPTDEQIQHLVDALRSTFASEAIGVVDAARSRLAQPIWYEGLEESDMGAWEGAICSLLQRPEFKQRLHGVHGAVSCMFIELASLVFANRQVDAVVRRFWPYRFLDLCVRTRVGRDPALAQFQTYDPAHALLTNAQVGQLLQEVSEYQALLDELAAVNSHLVTTWRPELEQSQEDVLRALTEIYQSDRMWLAHFD